MLGKRIYELRKKLNISQEEFAMAINTSRQSVSKWELGVSYPEVNKLKDIARFFNVSIDYLLDYDLVNTSCEEFITKLNIAFQNKDFSITVNEIKSYILRFNNNIYLYMYSAKYLLALELDKNQQNLLDLIISYCKKVISLYDSQERNDIVLNDIHIFVIQTYLIYKKHDLAMEYMKENKVYNEAFLAECYYRLKKYNDVSNTFSNLYVSALGEIFSTTHLQIRVLLKQKNVDEAYELTNWIINLIDSIIKKKDAFTQIQIVYLYLKLVCEKMLKISCAETICKFNTLLNNTDFNSLNTENIKFYYGEKQPVYSDIKDYKNKLKEEILQDKDENFNIFKEVFEEIFEEDINE